MKTIKAVLLVAAILCAANVQAAIVTLFDYGLNHDGVISPPGLGGGFNLAAFDTSTGLGSIQASLSGAGSHYVGVFLDHEIDEVVNTFFNEVGSTQGVPGAGQTWEIDEPGYVFGDIYDNFLAGVLDNTIGTSDPDDVSMALGWDFTLATDENAEVLFSVGLVEPAGVFYLAQTDPDSGASIYFSSSLTIIGGPQVPDGGSTLALLACTLFGLAALRRKP